MQTFFWAWNLGSEQTVLSVSITITVQPRCKLQVDDKETSSFREVLLMFCFQLILCREKWRIICWLCFGYVVGLVLVGPFGVLKICPHLDLPINYTWVFPQRLHVAQFRNNGMKKIRFEYCKSWSRPQANSLVIQGIFFNSWNYFQVGLG